MRSMGADRQGSLNLHLGCEEEECEALERELQPCPGA